jgi:hypothetical protein
MYCSERRNWVVHEEKCVNGTLSDASIDWIAGGCTAPYLHLACVARMPTRSGGCRIIMLHRDYGLKDFATDVKLSEDASFLLSMPWRHEWVEEVTYVGQ